MSRRHSVAELKAALEKYHGGVSLAAQSVDMTPQGLYKRIKDSPELRETCWACRASLRETALLQLEVKVRAGELAAVKHALAVTKDWDYLTREEVEADGNSAPQVEEEVEPELNRAVQRVLDFVAAEREASLIRPGDILPPGFEAPR